MKPARFARLAPILGTALLAFALPFSAGATVKKEGTWPGVDKKVDLEFDGKASEGLKQLAHEAGWSLVVKDPALLDRQGHDVHVNVESQPADAVLEALFVGRNVIAHRTGKLITLAPADGPAGADLVPPPPVPPPPPAAPTPPEPPSPPAAPAPPAPPDPAAQVDPLRTPPPVPTIRGEDRDVLGGNLVIHKNEIVHSVTVTGGSVKVEGTVTGDLVVMGGSAKLAHGARVVGNATVMGGSLKIEKDARIDGDIGIAGGSLKREPGSIVGGKVSSSADGTAGDEHAGLAFHPGDSPATSSDDSESRRSRISEAAHSFGQSMTKMALLFVLGCVLLALLAPRMEKVRGEIAARPMRSFATGLVWTLLGSVGAAIVLGVLCITVIGIPVAVLAVLAAVLAVYGAIASVLTTFGAAVIGHKTQNPYLHLLLGCGAFLVLSAIPYLGGLVTFVITMVAVGALIATRVGGLLERKRKYSSGLV